MFTGIIQGAGTVTECRKSGGECRLTITPSFAIPNIIDGESIAVNGVCLSVEHHSGSVFSMYASAETLSRTTHKYLQTGSIVNLERALAVGDRLGGHIVAGHVDCLAHVESVTPAGASLVCRFSFPPAWAGEVVSKGSVALDGISLTINDCGPDWFTVNIIPDTQQRTTMRLWKPGVQVNMETDVVGKYVRRLLGLGLVPGAQQSPQQPEQSGGVTLERLLENGFL